MGEETGDSGARDADDGPHPSDDDGRLDAGVGGDPSTDAPTSIAKDDAFHVLQNRRRRATLRYILLERDREQFSMSEVVEAVAAWENDTTVSDLTDPQRQRVYISLYQSHLPKLDEHGVVHYDRTHGTITRTPLASMFEPLLDLGHGLDAPEEFRVDPDDESGTSSGVERLLSKFRLP